jgi:hypothetical protein
MSILNATTMKCFFLLSLCLLLFVSPSFAATKKGKQKSKEAAAARKREWDKDPKHCEVCLKVMSSIHTKMKALPKKQQKQKEKIETLIEKYCSKKNKEAGPKERKLCYYLLPIKRSISTPLAFGADPTAVCKKLERTSAEVCTVKYSINTAGTKAEPVNYKKMRVKHLKQILRERGVSCRGCTDKREFVKKCEDTEHLAAEL